MRRALLVAATVVIALALAPLWSPLVGLGPRSAPAPGTIVELPGGHRLNLFDEGEGQAVVLIHGRPGSAYDWEPLPAGLLAAGYRVIRYDRVGYGYSSRRRLGESFTLTANMNELGELLDVLRLDRVALIGWSYGGGVGQLFASRFPERLRALLLVASLGPGGSTPRPGREWAERLLRWTGPLNSWALAAGFPARPGVRRAGEVFFAGDPPHAWEEQTIALLGLRGAMQSFVSEMAMRAAEGKALDPSAIRVPATLLIGTADRAGALESAELLHARIRSSRLVSIEGGSHMLPNTHAELIARELTLLLR